MNNVRDKCHHYHFSDLNYEFDPVKKTYEIQQKIVAKVVDMTNEAIIQAVISAAKEAGITDLYLLDKKFVLEALMEKRDRERWAYGK